MRAHLWMYIQMHTCMCTACNCTCVLQTYICAPSTHTNAYIYVCMHTGSTLLTQSPPAYCNDTYQSSLGAGWMPVSRRLKLLNMVAHQVQLGIFLSRSELVAGLGY